MPVDTSSFTPSQLAAYNYAKSIAPSQGASASTPSSGLIPMSLYNIQGNGAQTVQQPNAGVNNAQSFNQGSTPLGTSNTPMTTMYKSDGTTVQVPTANVGLNTYDATSNPSGYYLSNPVASTAPSTTGASTNTPPTYTPNSLSYGGLISGGLNTAGGVYAQAEQNLLPYIQQQQQVISQAQNELTNTLGGTYSAGTSGDFTGRQGQLQQVIQNAEANINNAQGQLTSSYSPETSAYGQAISAAAPQGNYPFVFNPLTGSFSTAGGSTGSVGLTHNPSTDIPAAVQAIQSNHALYNSYAQAITSGYGSNGSIIKAQLDAALLQAGLNPTNLAAEGVGQASATTNYSGTLLPAFQASQGVKNTLDQFITSNPSLNTAQITAGNALQQWINGQQLGNPNVQTFLNDISEYVQTLAPLLGVGGTPTDAKAYVASQFVNAQASGQSVQQVLNNIETLAQNKLNYYAGGATGTQPSPIIPQTSTNTSTGGSIYDF